MDVNVTDEVGVHVIARLFLQFEHRRDSNVGETMLPRETKLRNGASASQFRERFVN